MVVRVVHGDLLDQDVDVIVNAWNRNIIPWWLLIPQGVSGAIKKRGEARGVIAEPAHPRHCRGMAAGGAQDGGEQTLGGGHGSNGGQGVGGTPVYRPSRSHPAGVQRRPP